MPDPLVIQLQTLALSTECSTSDLLRKALITAEKLGLADFSEWIRKELNGYSESDSLPAYRRLRGEIKYWNPYHGWCPVVFQESHEHEIVTRAGGYEPAEGGR